MLFIKHMHRALYLFFSLFLETKVHVLAIPVRCKSLDLQEGDGRGKGVKKKIKERGKNEGKKIILYLDFI